MKPRMLVVALIATLGSGCSSLDRPRQAMDVEPLLSIRHGAPDAQSYYLLGRYYQGQRRLAQAEAAYLKAIAVDQTLVDAYNALASLYAERGELDRSAKMFERATAMAPKAAYLYNNLGFAYYLGDRLDDAYAAVRKALKLDNSLARAWVNLEKIAARHPQPLLLATAKARRLDALPSEFSAAAPAPPDSATVQLAVDPASAAPLTLAPLAGSSAGATVHAADDRQPPDNAQETQEATAASKFVLVSAKREVIANAGVIVIGAAPADHPPPEPRALPLPSARLEVSNANGVSRCARNFSAKLRSDDIPVARITNFGSSLLQQTVIEYQPGYEDAARALSYRTQLSVRLIPASRPRPGSDIRIVLGWDARELG